VEGLYLEFSWGGLSLVKNLHPTILFPWHNLEGLPHE